MKKAILMTMAGFMCLLSVGVAHSFSNYSTYYPVKKQGGNQCVPHKLAMEAWSKLVDKMDRPSIGVSRVYAVCNPCSCPINGMAACYEYMAAEERAKTEKHRYMKDLLEQAEKYGICGR